MMMLRVGIKVLIIGMLTTCFASTALGVEQKMRELQKKNLVKDKFWPSRLGDKEERKCEACEEKEAKAKMEYLSRVLANDDAGDYPTKVRELVLQDEKFIKNCWDRLTPKGVEFFFTVNAAGEVEDIASFPRKIMTRCLKRRVKKMDFPTPDEAKHIWLVVSDL
jgi:hypothetical protein